MAASGMTISATAALPKSAGVTRRANATAEISCSASVAILAIANHRMPPTAASCSSLLSISGRSGAWSALTEEQTRGGGSRL